MIVRSTFKIRNFKKRHTLHHQWNLFTLCNFEQTYKKELPFFMFIYFWNINGFSSIRLLKSICHNGILVRNIEMKRWMFWNLRFGSNRLLSEPPKHTQNLKFIFKCLRKCRRRANSPSNARTHIFNHMIRNNSIGQQMLFFQKSLNGIYRSERKISLNRAYAEYLWATSYLKCDFYLLRWIWFIRRTICEALKTRKILNEQWNLASKQSLFFWE